METKEKYLLLTGASSGIGRCLAINLSAGYNLILHGRNEERLNITRSLCNSQRNHLLFKYDLTNIAGIENGLTSFVQANNVEITHLVHCAGFMKMVPVKMVNTDLINSIFTTNVFSAILLTKVLLQRKVNNDALRNIVFISSNISNFGAKAMSLYGSSKGALDSFMRGLAVELAPKVRVNSVLPGAIQTEMTENVFEDEKVSDRMKSTYPLGFGKAEDIFGMVEFLLSDKSSWITGQQFTVDGGRTINITG